MAPSVVHDHLSLLARRDHSSWITLDAGAIMLPLVAWALGAAFAFGGLALAAAAAFPQPRAERAKRAQQAVLCCALAAMMGFGLPVLFEGMGRAARDTLALMAVLWAPALAGLCGLLVYRTGRRRE
jgi:hypothetical protein